MRPFVVIGAHRLLESLRRLGFRTFTGFIDEEYDTLPDRHERFAAAYAEIRRLAALPERRVALMLHSMRHILEHNRSILDEMPARVRTRLVQHIAAP
jgi:hypothetical protein